LSTPRGLGELVVLANAYTGSWHNSQLAWEISQTLWNIYDPEGNLSFPNIPQHWDKLLQKTIDDGSYEKLSKDEVLSTLFGLHHRNRIIDGLWCSMFERGVTQKLLVRLLALDADKLGLDSD
jgi:hypothetical protein